MAVEPLVRCSALLTRRVNLMRNKDQCSRGGLRESTLSILSSVAKVF